MRLVERSGLIPLEDVRKRLKGKELPNAALPLAKMLVQNGVLTTFQADQLLQGKSRGFFLGNYRVLQRLGGGATAGVFLCEHRVMGNRVAVKVLSQDLVNQDQKNVQRFRREARAAAALTHPNIVRTMDFGEDQGRYFLVMEYVEGKTLDHWMQRNPNAPARAHVHFILQAAQGLRHIDESGLIHRDIKPTNLLLDKQGTVKILDLGLAKFTDDRNDGLSKLQGSHIMGTVDFMSPEQADGSQALDIRGDIYSLGATLYYLLTGGKVPFSANTLGAKMIAIQFQQPKAISEFRPEVDPLLEKIVSRMMAKDPAARFQTPKEAIAALQGWLKRSSKKADTGDGPPSIRTRKTAASAAPMPATVPEGKTDWHTRARDWMRSKWFAWTLRAAVLLLIVGGLAIVKPWNFGHKSSAQPQTTANK